MRILRRRRCRSCYRTGVRKDVSAVCIDCPHQHGDGIPFCPEHFKLTHQSNHPFPYTYRGSGLFSDDNIANQESPAFSNDAGNGSVKSEQVVAPAGTRSSNLPEQRERQTSSN